MSYFCWVRWGNPQDPRYGDVHYYNYAADCLNPAIYPRAKFISEFGFQSYPSWQAYKSVSAPEDWNVNSDLSDFRQGPLTSQLQFMSGFSRELLANPSPIASLNLETWFYGYTTSGP